MINVSSRLLFAGFVFPVVVAFGMSGESKPKETVIDERAFRFTLPGQWSREPSSDPTRWSYQNDHGEYLTVSLLGFSSGMGAEERSKVFNRLVEMRKHAETALPGFTAVTTTQTTFGESGGILAARYSGIQSAVHRRFTCLMLGSSSAFTVFYYEAVGLSKTQSEARAKAIMNSIIVAH